MPTYEYLCRKCGHTFEEFQSMSHEPLKHCPKCGTDNLARVMGTGGGFILKGSGFYGTDYRKQQSGAGDSGKKDGGKEETGKKKTRGKVPEKIDTEKKDTEKKDTKKNDGGKESPGSQPSSPPPPEKKD